MVFSEGKGSSTGKMPTFEEPSLPDDLDCSCRINPDAPAFRSRKNESHAGPPNS